MNTITLPQKPKKEIEIKLITDLGEEYHLSQTNFNLPLDCTSEKLNELVNKMLKLSSPKKFSFFINNIKLTTSLTEFVNTNMISTENVVEIFYMFEMNEPQLKNTIKEDEWIKDIQIFQEMKFSPLSHRSYCVGLFNGEISFYNGESNQKEFELKNILKSDEDTLALLTGVKFFKSVNSNNNLLIRTMRNSKYTFEVYDINTSKQNSTLLFSSMKRNDESFSCIDVNPSNFDIFALGGAEDEKGTVKLYKIPELNVKTENSAKKRKIERNTIEPYFSFNDCHNANVSCISWMNPEQLITGGDDFNLNLYNTESKNLYMSFNTNYKNVNCIKATSQNTFLAGYQDGSIKFYDAKASNKSVLQFKDPKAFCGFISDISMSNDKENHPNTFVSSSYDSALKIWDIRGGSVPLYKMETKSCEKNYTVKFNGVDTIISGGDDSSVNIFTY